MSDRETLVRVENVQKKFCRSLRRSMRYGMFDMVAEVMGGSRSHDHLRKDEFWAVNGVSFELRRGECLGLIGHNGAGKTTLLRMLNGLIKPDHGRITMKGRVGALIALGAGFNPVLSGRENIYINASVLGLSKRQIDAKVDEIIEFAEIGKFIDSPVQTYSSGMYVRLGFSIAVNLLEPDVLILDEVLAVGDAAFKAKCEKKVSEIIQNSAVIFVSHEASHIRRLCDKVLWLDRGCQKAMGHTKDILPTYEKAGELLAGSSQSSLTKIEAIDSIVSEAVPSTIAYGRSLRLSFKIKTTRPVAVGFVVLGIAQGSALAAQANIKTNFTIDQQRTLLIETGPLALKNGVYKLNLALYGGSYKELVARYMSFGEIVIDSGADGFCYYQVEATTVWE